jgi:hypothetical protein
MRAKLKKRIPFVNTEQTRQISDIAQLLDRYTIEWAKAVQPD